MDFGDLLQWKPYCWLTKKELFKINNKLEKANWLRPFDCIFVFGCILPFVRTPSCQNKFSCFSCFSCLINLPLPGWFTDMMYIEREWEHWQLQAVICVSVFMMLDPAMGSFTGSGGALMTHRVVRCNLCNWTACRHRLIFFRTCQSSVHFLLCAEPCPASHGLPVGEETAEQQSCRNHHQHPLRRVGPQG